MTPAQCRAARRLAGFSQQTLAQVADVPRNVIVDFEVHTLPPRPAYMAALLQALERVGIAFVEGDGVEMMRQGSSARSDQPIEGATGAEESDAARIELRDLQNRR